MPMQPGSRCTRVGPGPVDVAVTVLSGGGSSIWCVSNGPRASRFGGGLGKGDEILPATEIVLVSVVGVMVAIPRTRGCGGGSGLWSASPAQ